MEDRRYDQETLISEFWRAWNNFVNGIAETLTTEDVKEIKRRRREREERERQEGDGSFKAAV